MALFETAQKSRGKEHIARMVLLVSKPNKGCKLLLCKIRRRSFPEVD